MKPTGKSCVDDQLGVSEVLGTILSLAITVLLFSVVAISVMGQVGSNTAGMAYIHGELYTESDKIVLTHIGGDPVRTTNMKVRLFVNNSDMFEPNFTMLTHGYTIDNDGAWQFSDRLMIDHNISEGSTLEVIIIDERSSVIIGSVDLIYREGQVAPTTGSPTATTTAANTTTTTTVSTTSTPIPVAIYPVLECVADNGDGTYTAYYGYMNPNDWTVNLPIGADNKFNPEPQNRGQPTSFECGRHYAVFNVVFDGSYMEWYLDGSTAPASSDPGLRCPELELTSICDGYWMVENSAPYGVTFDWTIVGSSENGTRTIPAYYGTLISPTCEWRWLPVMNMKFWTTNCSDNGGSMTMRIYVDGELIDQTDSNCDDCFPHCYDFYMHSARAYGTNNSTVEFIARTFQSADAQITQITASWTFSIGGRACTVNHITLDRPGLDCEVDTLSPHCFFINNSTSCTMPAKKDIAFIMIDFRDENGYLMDMRGATIAFVIEGRCQGVGPFYEHFLVDVPL